MDDLDSGLVWAGLLGSIQADLEALIDDLTRLKDERERLESAGMYPCVPSESWETRNGAETEYLRMVFGRERPAGWPRKKYVGCKPGAVQEARRLARNRELWERLDYEIAKLERFLMHMGGSLRHTAEAIALYQVSDLGIAIAGPGAPRVPKEEMNDGT